MLGAPFSGSGGGGGGVAPVSPSVVDHFVSFSNTTGTQKDSGYSASSFVRKLPVDFQDNQITLLVDITALTIFGYSGQTANLFEVQNSSSSVIASIGPTGRGTFTGMKLLTSTLGKDLQYSLTGGISHNGPDDSGSSAEALYSANRNYTGAIGASLSGGAMRSSITYTPTSNQVSVRVSAIYGSVTKNGSFNGGSATPSWMAGLYGETFANAGIEYRMVGVIASIVPGGTATVTHAIGVLSNMGGDLVTGVTNQYGVVVATSTLGITSFTATPTNMYGLYIENINSGTTLNYAIYTNQGLIHFGDSIDLASLKNITLIRGNIITDGSVGTKIGTATTQKLGFWNKTPIVQPAAANQAALTDSTGGTYDGVLDDVTTAGISDPAKVNSNFTDVFTLLNEIRTALVNTGIMKGAA